LRYFVNILTGMIVLCKISFVCIYANALQAHNEGYLSPTVAQTKHANSLIINDSYQANA
jgi:hypothetical protein